MLWPMLDHHFDWLIPDWPAPQKVRAMCTTRSGGTSTGPYAGLNLGTHVGDDIGCVQSNRALLQQALGVRVVFMNQVHGTDVVGVGPLADDGLQADGAWTTSSGVACTVMVADCLPVLLCDAHGKKVAAAHAGWRGLLGINGWGVLEAAASALNGGGNEPSTAGAGTLMAWLGPCIGPKAFEVGDEVRAAFVSASPEAAACFVATSQGKWLADLPALARQRLAALGIARTFGNDGSDAWCTVANPSRFFSHRRDRVSGRLAACIWLTD